MSRTLLLAVAIALALGWFAGLGHRKLVRADESRYGEIPREMVATGNWLTPRLDGFKYFEKPPLQYWATASAYEAFGVSEWATRLWPALTGFAGLLLVFFAGNRAFGRPVGEYAALALAGSALYAALGHVATLDMGVSFFLSFAVLAFVLAQLDSTPAPARRGWMLGAWAAAALAVLSKGLIGVVLPGGALILYMLWQRDARPLRRLHPLAGLAVFAAIAVPWFVAVSAANPEFARFFFIHEHFERFLTKTHDRYEPVWYFVPVLLVGAMPWLVSLGAALWRLPRIPEPGEFKPVRFLVAWCVAVFAFFSVSDSKLPSYILPIFPALALLVGVQLRDARRGLVAAQALLAALAGAALLALAAGLPDSHFTVLPRELLAAYQPWLYGAGAALGLGGLAAAALAWRGRTAASVLALAAGGLICVQTALAGRETLSPAYSAYDLVRRVRPSLTPGAPIYAVRSYDHTLPFYLGRTVTLVAFQNELAPGTAWEPERYIADLPTFAAAWRRERVAYAVFRKDEYEQLRERYHLRTEVIASDANLVFVRKP